MWSKLLENHALHERPSGPRAYISQKRPLQLNGLPNDLPYKKVSPIPSRKPSLERQRILELWSVRAWDMWILLKRGAVS